MKLALAVFENRISVIFDNSRQLLIVSINDDFVVDRKEVSLNTLCTIRMVEQLKEESVGILICGAISDNLQRVIERNEIKVIPWISGPVQNVLDAWFNGTLERLVMPGCSSHNARRYNRGW